MMDVEKSDKEIKYGIEFIKIGNNIQRIAGTFHKQANEESNNGSKNYILGFIADHECEVRGVYQKDIEKELSLTGPTVSKVLKHMEEKGLLERVPDEHDGRLKKLHLTQEARNRRLANADKFAKMEENLLDGMTPKEVEQLKDFLWRINQNLNKFYK
jgi:DNA-binding MarR family transcriptional regulator